MKVFCETSFKIEALKIKNESFLQDFLQKWSFEAPKPSFSARLPSKTKLRRSKMKVFCETSSKIEALKLKNEAFLRDFLQKWSFEAPKPNFSARLPSKMKLWSSKTKLFCETSFKNDMSTRHLTSELQYVLAIFNWMLQKYCACHEKVMPRHTNSCNCHAKWSLQSNTSVTWNLQPFHGFSVGGFEHRHHKARNHCACHVKRIVSDPLQINPPRLPTFLQPSRTPAPAAYFATCRNPCACHAKRTFNLQRLSRAPGVLTILTSKSLSRAGVVQILRSSTSKSAPNPRCFNDFDFRIALARNRGANFVEINFQKWSGPASF